MTVAASAVTRIGYIAESAWGTTPATPAFQVMRVTDAGIRTNKTTKTIQEIAADRNIRDEPQTYQSASAAYKFALSYGSFDDILAAALFGQWSTNVLKNGTTRQSFTFEGTLQLNGSLSFSRLLGGMIDSLDLDITAESEVTGGFNVMGQKETLATAIISGATYTAANNNPVMSAGVSPAALTVGSLVSPAVHKVSWSLKNSLRARPVVDSLYSLEFGEGLCDVTGALELYFTSNAHYQAVLDHGGGDLTVTIGNSTGNKYTIDCPNIVFLDGARQVGGVNNDVMINIPFRAKYNSGTSNTITITRAVA